MPPDHANSVGITITILSLACSNLKNSKNYENMTDKIRLSCIFSKMLYLRFLELSGLEI